MKIDENRYSQVFRSSIFIDFRYQSINYYRLLSITIDFIDYRISLIGHAGINKMAASFYATYPTREISLRLLVNKYGDLLYFSRILDVAMKMFLFKK